MKRNSDFLMRQVADRYVLAPVGEMAKKFSGMITMNETGKFLWELLEQEQTLDSLLQALADTYEIDGEKVKPDVVRFLEPLQEIEAIVD